MNNGDPTLFFVRVRPLKTPDFGPDVVDSPLCSVCSGQGLRIVKAFALCLSWSGGVDELSFERAVQQCLAVGNPVTVEGGRGGYIVATWKCRGNDKQAEYGCALGIRALLMFVAISRCVFFVFVWRCCLPPTAITLLFLSLVFFFCPAAAAFHDGDGTTAVPDHCLPLSRVTIRLANASGS